MDGAWRAGDGKHHFIGNRWATAASGESLPVIDPSNGQPFARIARGNAADIDAAVAAARAPSESGPWGRLHRDRARAPARPAGDAVRRGPRNSARWRRATPASR